MESLYIAYIFFVETRDAKKDGTTSKAEQKEDDDEQQQISVGESEERPSLSPLSRAVTLKHKLIMQPRSESARTRLIRRLDSLCLVVFPLSYIIFIAVMLGTNKRWGT